MSTEISELLSVQTNHSFYTGVRISETAGFHRVTSATFFAGGPSVQDGGVHRLWFLLSIQY